MHFDAADPDIPAAGKSLTAVSVTAGSSSITVADGSVLDDGDVGKQISIPGAADMRARLVGFPDSRTIQGAKMEAGEDVLRFTLPSNVDGFRTNPHVNWRIVVEGAGPGGGRLVTKVNAIIESKSRLQLADTTSVGVDSATAILNDPGAALLEDHARASVGPLTIQLHDRTITDAFMKVGSKRIRSATASFSADDLGRAALRVVGAGHLVTTITGTSAGGVEFADAAERPVENGTAVLWDPDKDALPGFLELMVLVRDAGPGPHEIEFAPGVYDFKRPPEQPGAMDAVIRLEGLEGLTLRGAGVGATILRLMPEQNLVNDAGNVMDTHVVMARNCSQLSIRDLSVDAAYLNMQCAVEQMHSVFISHGCTDTLIADVGVVHSAGDAVRLLGEPEKLVERVRVERCQLMQAKRSGVAVQRSVRTATIRDCTIEMSPPSTGSCLDFEPSGDGAPEDFVIESNVLVHDTDARAVSLSGTGDGPATRHIRFIGNVLDGGGVGGVNGQDVTITGNVITAGPDSAFSLDGFDDLTISRNLITVTAPGRAGIQVVRRPNVESHNVNIHDNELAVTGAGIDISSGGDHIDISSNHILGSGTPVGIRVRLIGAAVHRDVRITYNSVTNFTQAGIRLIAAVPQPDDPFQEVTVIDVDISSNYLHVDAAEPSPNLAGISLQGPHPKWLEQVLISGNLIGESIPKKIDRGPLAFAIGGNPGEATIYQGSVSPHVGPVVAPPGSLFVWTPGGTTPAQVFLKVSGVGAQGWRRIHVLPWPWWIGDLFRRRVDDPDQPVAGDV